jgi:hypothetical protein
MQIEEAKCRVNGKLTDTAMKTWNGRRIYHKTTLQNKKQKRGPDGKHPSRVQGLKQHCRSQAHTRIHTDVYCGGTEVLKASFIDSEPPNL